MVIGGKMNTNIFREYDIRGIYPEDIDGHIAYKIGRSFASYIKNKEVMVAYDNRLSSLDLHFNLVKGLLDSGANVIDFALATSPIYYFYKHYLKIENGIMITASHNPRDYNGFKISFNIKGNACGKEIADFKDFTLKEQFDDKKGTYNSYRDNDVAYLEKIKDSINLGNRRLKVVFDPGNGTSAIIIKSVVQMFNIDPIYINDGSNGSFPNHHPDPCVPENMVELGNTVRENHCDLGIGIDGDADRVGVVDENGDFIPIDLIMIIIYKYLYPNMKNKKAIMDVKCSKALLDEMERIGLDCEICRTGAVYLRQKITDENLDFGGEFSGHLCFKDKFIGTDDGIYAALRIIEILSNSNESMSSLVKKIPKYVATPEIKIEVKEEQKDILLQKVKDYLDSKKIKYLTVDGIRINYEDGFTLIRKSNTGPHITVRFEKKTENDLNKEKEEFLNLIKKISLELN